MPGLMVVGYFWGSIICRVISSTTSRKMVINKSVLVIPINYANEKCSLLL
jgi:hypothetical protein